MKADITIGEKFPAYHAYPDDGKKHPGLIVIHEIWGLDAHIKDVADRFAAQGYDVVAPNLFSDIDFGKDFGPELYNQMMDPDTRDEAQKKMRERTAPVYAPEFGAAAVAKLKQCVEFLLADAACDGRVAVVGFCFGGTYSFALAAEDSRIKAAVPFYGRAPSREQIEHIEAPMLAFYGEEDENLMQALPQLQDEMCEADKNFSAVVYPNVGHAFFNDRNPRRYDRDSAQSAWRKTLEFLKQHLPQ